MTHKELEKCIHIKHTIQNSDFFDIDSIFNEYITNHIKKLEKYFAKYDFKLVSNQEFTPHIKSEIEFNQSEFYLKKI